jgi:hypothetical protein
VDSGAENPSVERAEIGRAVRASMTRAGFEGHGSEWFATSGALCCVLELDRGATRRRVITQVIMLSAPCGG